MGVKEQEQTVVIQATPAACFAAITDYESYPEWQQAVQEIEVLERDDQGRGKLVRFVLDVLLKRVEYTLRYEYPQGHGLRWSLVAGDMKQSDGSYAFEELGDGSTRATFSLAVDPGMFVPGPIVKKLNNVLMKGSIHALKERVEEGG